MIVPFGHDRPTPYSVVTSGHVRAVVPTKWDAAPIADLDSLQEGVMASPNLDHWGRMDGSVPGLEAMWVDVARGGIPSDFYYLAATGPAIPHIVSSRTCTGARYHVIVNHRPDFAGGDGSPGDYAVRGSGRCTVDGRPTRYAYFVAAPGFGPERRVGIPDSGLYVVVTVVPDSPYADKQLRTMLFSARFDHTSVGQLIHAARHSAQMR